MDSVDLIERYFEGALTEVELTDFQRRLESDEAFAQAFQLEKDLMEGIETLGNENLRSELEGIYEEEVEGNNNSSVKPKTPIVQFQRRRWLFVAAAILMLLVSYWWLNRPTPERLYADNFKPAFDLVEKGSNEKKLAQAEAFLKDGAYAPALPLLDDLIKQAPENTEYLLAKGIALMETNDHEAARQTFQKVQKLNPLFKKEAIWYNALSFLKQGNAQEAYDLLMQIPDHQAASILAKRLKRLLN